MPADDNLDIADDELTVDSRAKLVLESRELGRRLASTLLRRWNVRMTPEEVESIVDLTLCEAAATFCQKRGTKFSSFLFYYLRGNLLKAIDGSIAAQRAVQAVATSVSIGESGRNKVIEAVPDDEATSVDPDYSNNHAETPEDSFLRKERRVMIAKLCTKLSQVEQEVISRMFVLGQSLESVAEALGYSRREILRIREKALKRLLPLALETELASSRSKSKSNLQTISPFPSKLTPGQK